MAVKVTFTLDEETVARLGRAAARARKPKSAVVREAIREYEARAERLGEEEKRRMLEVLARLERLPAARPQGAVEREIAAVRAERRSGGRRHPVA